MTSSRREVASEVEARPLRRDGQAAIGCRTRAGGAIGAGLPRYPGYKDSGVEWLGAVPRHWAVERLKASLENVVDQSVGTGDERNIVALEHVESWTGRVTPPSSDWTVDGHLKRFRAGDILFGKLRPYLAKVARLGGDGLCVGEFLVLRPRSGNVDGAYVEHLLRSKPIIDAVNSSTFGAKMPRADWRFIGGMPLGRPPFPEQAAIVRFLDHAERRIRRYIRAKQKLIALLEEQKQVLIHEVVTGRIDVRTGRPYPAYKDSGVEWLGGVPSHWRVLRLKDVADVQTGITLGKDYRHRRTISRPYLRVANVQDGHLKLIDVKSVDVPVTEAERARLVAGDVLMTEGGDIDKLGRGCVWRGEIGGCLHQNHIFAVRCRRAFLSPDFLVRLMESRHARVYFELTAKRTTNLACTNGSTLRAFPVPLPAPDEQRGMVDAIASHRRGLGEAMDRTEREIDLMREYERRLIAAVVTGKLDVREAATRLSDTDPLAAGENPVEDFKGQPISEAFADGEGSGPEPDDVGEERTEAAAGAAGG